MNDKVDIGNLLGITAKRDAIHIAIAPVIAAERLEPGQTVALNGASEAVAVDDAQRDRARRLTKVGIVDPFLTKAVQRGDRFYVFLYPNTVTSMRHHWSHPCFHATDSTGTVETNEATVSQSREWLHAFAIEHEHDYHKMLNQAQDGDICFGSEDYPSDEKWAEFWRHVQNVTGKTFTQEHIQSTDYRCAC